MGFFTVTQHKIIVITVWRLDYGVYMGAEYDAGVPDYITLQMIQVTDLFSDT